VEWLSNLRCLAQFLRDGRFDVAQRIGLGQERRTRNGGKLLWRTTPRGVDDRQSGPHRVDQLRESSPVHARAKIDVGEQEVAIGAGEKMAQRPPGIGRGHDGETLVGQRRGHHRPEQGLILDQQHDFRFRLHGRLLGGEKRPGQIAFLNWLKLLRIMVIRP